MFVPTSDDEGGSVGQASCSFRFAQASYSPLNCWCRQLQDVVAGGRMRNARKRFVFGLRLGDWSMESAIAAPTPVLRHTG